MAGAARWPGLDADFGNPPDLAERRHHRRRVAAIEQREIAERPHQRILRPGQAGRDQIDRRDRGARRRRNLQGQRDRTFDMRLHRAGALRMGQPEHIAEAFRRQPGQPRDCQRPADHAGGGGAEEFQRGFGGEPRIQAISTPVTSAASAASASARPRRAPRHGPRRSPRSSHGRRRVRAPHPIRGNGSGSH